MYELQKKMIEAIEVLDVKKPSRKQIKDDALKGRTIVGCETGLREAESISKTMSNIVKSVSTSLEARNKYSDKDEFEDDGLIEALTSSYVDMEDDSAMVIGDDE